MKMCRGALHREGVMLPLHRFFFLKSGHRAGKPMSECADCWRHRKGNTYSIPVEIILPIIARLKEELGSYEAISLRLGVAKNQISVVKHQERVRGKFVGKLIALDHEIAQEKKTRWLNQFEPLVVESEPFGSVLRGFCKAWLNERPLDMPVVMTPYDFMNEKTGISVRQIARYCNSERPWISLSHADALLVAIGRQELLMTDEIKVIANPTWSLEAYVAYMKERGCV